jgi:hypothetical protein
VAYSCGWIAVPVSLGQQECSAAPSGVTNVRTFVDPQNPSQVALLMDMADMDAVMGAMQTKAASEAMADDGVLTESLVILVEE